MELLERAVIWTWAFGPVLPTLALAVWAVRAWRHGRRRTGIVAGTAATAGGLALAYVYGVAVFNGSEGGGWSVLYFAPWMWAHLVSLATPVAWGATSLAGRSVAGRILPLLAILLPLSFVVAMVVAAMG